ncbi:MULTISPECIES: type II pantothenate kinase [Psychrobacillus]|uniref:Type II pantothenate kinase n=1 Tax=Psychrobacillus faecigallinarum TaxID=2762235 RepID=A0ABR8R936_9BACI|nr:type II pantothenate kinase [Psychrobacillus faecigallinarum]MBD7944314.1 type II pantothenate kinase [Psychrobacillus faecigallinarum]QGM30305.1 type II pantothenate kinase [Bacillus sp. N3536]
MTTRIGIDAGGTLTKIAYWDRENKMSFKSFLSSDFQGVREWIENKHSSSAICLTGGRAEQLKKFLLSKQDLPYMVEFDATMNGVMYQMKQEVISSSSAIIANIGTGTSIHIMHDKTHSRIAGSGIGGGTLLGLGMALTGLTNYKEMIALSKDGKRSTIDVLVSDIYKDNKLPITGSLTASNFGGVTLKPEQARSRADLLAGIQGIIGEVVATLCIQAAEAHGVKDIIYIGSTLEENSLLQEIIESYTILKNKNPIFLEKHGYSGAIGALLENN